MPTTFIKPHHIRFIKKNRLKMSGYAMECKFGFTKGIITRWLSKNGLQVSHKLRVKFRAEGLRGITSSTPAVDKFLTKHYLTVNVNQLSIKIGRSETFVKTRLRQLNLVIPRRIIEQRKKESQIKKGHVPMNKGLKQKDYMSKEAINKTKATRFQTGQIPHNAVGFKDGDIRIRHRKNRDMKPHKYIRIKLGVWQELQIYNWEKKNGPVPKGFVLACKDGDTLNCRPSNWYLMSMKDNMIRNSSSLRLTDGYVAFTLVGRNGMHRYDEILKNKELIETKRLQLQLNRTIKSKKDAQQQRSDRAA